MSLIGPALTENVTVIELDLRGNRLKDEGATRLARAIAGCGTLTKLLAGRNYIGCKGAAQLLTGNRLRVLMLEENCVNESDDGLSARWWNYGRQEVIDGAVSDSMYQVGQALASHPTIEHVSFAGNKVGDEAVIRLAHGVADSRSLLVLDLSNNIVTDKGAAALARALKRNKQVLDLNLNNNRIGNTGAKLLQKVLMQNEGRSHCVSSVS
jgi:Ran GTPase-activating protein (RanGAP) involved in mRNA processing and transport